MTFRWKEKYVDVVGNDVETFKQHVAQQVAGIMSVNSDRIVETTQIIKSSPRVKRKLPVKNEHIIANYVTIVTV